MHHIGASGYGFQRLLDFGAEVIEQSVNAGLAVLLLLEMQFAFLLELLALQGVVLEDGDGLAHRADLVIAVTFGCFNGQIILGKA